MIAVDKTSAQLYLTSTNDPSVEHQLIQVKAEDLTMAYAALCLLSPLTLHFILYWSPGYHLMWILTCGICVLWLRQDKFTWTTKSCGGKGAARPLSPGDSASTLALTGFYCFFGHITLWMILIYHAQVHFRQLQKTKERMLLIT